MRSITPVRRVAVLAAIALLAAACGGGNAKKTTSSGSGVLKGASFTVGGKEFTEQRILCEMTAQVLEAAGAKVKRQCGLSGSATVRTALTSGRIDMYWEYTGTGYITHLKHTTPIPDAMQQYAAVAKEDLEKNHIKWLTPAPFDNTYAIGVRADNMADVKTLSDYGQLASSNPQQASLCVATEFVNRDDGLPGLEKTYGFKLGGKTLATLDAGAIYNSIKKGNPCNFGEVFTTDGRIAGLGLRVLEDDKKFFAIYNPALTVRESVFKSNPDLEKVIDPVAKALDTATMSKLNADFDINGDTAADISKKFLKDKGLVK
ncbi:MAG: glycine betaine ABC transporter substrate-binding protein [Mycobacteriales bacterium]